MTESVTPKVELPPINLGEVDGSTARLMRDYATQAVLAERERAARICESLRTQLLAGAARSREEGEYGEGQWAEWNAQGAKLCAAAIRKG